MSRYQIVITHGEHASVFSVVDSHAPTEDQPCVIRSYSTEIDHNAGWLARELGNYLNAQAVQS